MKTLLYSLMAASVVVSCKTNDFSGESTRAAALPPLQTVEFTQDVREVRQVQLKQGSTGTTGNESYNVTTKGVVDIVVVVDNSGSMDAEQQNLSDRMAPLLSAISESDWRIMITTTDARTSCENSVISKGDFNPASRFQALVRNAGIQGSGLERSIYKAVEALKCRSWLQSWLRPQSTVAVLILTDEDNCHIDNERGYGCAGLADREGSYLTNYLASIRKVGTEARVYGIFWHPTQSQSQCSTALKQANIVADVVQATGGTWGSICDGDYSNTLTRISRDVAQILKADFTLKSTPDAGTFRLTVNGAPWSEYVLTGRNVHFTRNPPVGAAIGVSYVSGASGTVTNTFDIPEEPAEGAVTATIGGQSAGQVTYDPNSRKVVFAQRPADGSTIVLSYKANTPLKNVFNIAPDADTRYLKVAVNGQAVAKSNYQYDSGTGAITLNAPPPEGAKIRVEWRGKKRTT